MNLNRHLKVHGNAAVFLSFNGLKSDVNRDHYLFDDQDKLPIFICAGRESKLIADFVNLVKSEIGNLEANFAKRSLVYVRFFSRSENVSALDELHWNALLANQVGQHLWKIRDHAVNLETAYMVENKGDEIELNKNNIMSYFFNASGNANLYTHFSWNELRNAFRISTAENHYFSEDKPYTKEPTSRKKGSPRAIRFLTWLADARKQDDLLVRASLYVTALEALLSTSSSELSHQLSERVALFLDYSTPKSETFLKMKNCYSLRSKGLHGDTISDGQHRDLRELCGFLDEACRTFSVKISDDDDFYRLISSNNDTIDAAATKKIFED